MTTTMKNKSFRGILATVLAVAMGAVLAWPAVMGAQGIRSGAGAYYYFFQAVNEDGDPFTTEGAVRCSVYTRGSGDNATIVHTTATLATPYTLPLASNSNGIVHWYSTLNTPFNVKCFTQYGDYAYKNAVAITTHKLRIDTAGAYKISRFPYVVNAAPVDTGITIPAGAVVTGVAVERITGNAQFAHLDVGFTGNHTVATRNSLASRIDLSVTGYTLVHSASCFPPSANCVAATHLGAALAHTTTLAANGSLVTPREYMVHVNSGLNVSYTTSNTAGIGGHVYIFWRLMHVGANSWGQR